MLNVKCKMHTKNPSIVFKILNEKSLNIMEKFKLTEKEVELSDLSVKCLTSDQRSFPLVFCLMFGLMLFL